MNKERNKMVDISKGIGIILVILGHVLSQGKMKEIIYMFHMPLFFVLAGISFKYSHAKDSTFKNFFRKKI